MEVIDANNVTALLTSVAAYGGQLAAVFHHYALIAEKIPRGFEDAISIFDATVATIKQVLALAQDEAGSGDRMIIFSEDGIKYVHLLAKECANTFAKVEPAIAEACLERKGRKSKGKRSKKASSKKGPEIEVDPLALKLDEKDFLEKIEKTEWSWVLRDLGECLERLFDLQLHLLLVFQVAKVGILSKDLTCGKVDIQSIVTYHDRIKRTAALVGIKSATGRSANSRGRCGRRGSSSDSDYDSSSESDSDDSSIVSPKRTKKAFVPPPPPPPPPSFRTALPPPPPRMPPADPKSFLITPPALPPKGFSPELINIHPNLLGPILNNAKPPAYSESKHVIGISPSSTAVSPSLRKIPQANSLVPPVLAPEGKVAQTPEGADEKALDREEEPVEALKAVKSTIPEGHLLKSQSDGMGFKIKSLFRSKNSLALEMKQTLSDAESHLIAYVIQRHQLRQVPHSAFHSLEATHMRTILSQLNDNTWYKTFVTLDASEHAAVSRLIHPWSNGKFHERELVVLKVLEQNRLNAWMALLSELLRNSPNFFVPKDRVLLAIVRERFVDGKPLNCVAPFLPPPPPPPPPFQPPPPPPPSYAGPGQAIRTPPMPSRLPPRAQISDLHCPPPPPPANWRPNSSPQGPPRLPPSMPPPPPPPGLKVNSIRVIEALPLTDYEANFALTTYNEYTMRLVDSIDSNVQRSWFHVAITQESTDRHAIAQRVQQFESKGGNVIEAKLLMTEPQSRQATRLMDELKCAERDSRFEWSWVEISLYNNGGEITEFIPKAAYNIAASATVVHLIAKRSLKPMCKALDVYNSLMRGPPPAQRPPLAPGPPNPPGVIRLSSPSRLKKKSRHVDSSSESDSDSTSWSSDSSVRLVRSQLRVYKARQARSKLRRRRIASDFDSDSGSDSEDEDVIKVKIMLKRGDDVVEALLAIWTPDVEVKGKGKGKIFS